MVRCTACCTQHSFDRAETLCPTQVKMQPRTLCRMQQACPCTLRTLAMHALNNASSCTARGRYSLPSPVAPSARP